MTVHEDDLLAAYRDENGPSDPARARLLARLDALAAGGSDATTQDLAANSAPQARRGAVPWWAVAAVGLAAAVALIWWMQPQLGQQSESGSGDLASDRAASESQGEFATARTPSTSTQSTSKGARSSATPTPRVQDEPDPAPDEPVPAPEALDTPEATANTQDAPEPARARRRARPRTPVVPSTPPPSDSVAGEAQQIGQARAALSRGEPKAALRKLDAYDRRFAKGVLREEAAALRTIARCRVETSRGDTLATTFHRAHPRSLFAAQVDRACTPNDKSKKP